jgi:hypothetical protein
MFHYPLALAIATALAFLITWNASADDIPYCDEIAGRGGLCVDRDPIETYLVVSYVGAADGQGREIHAAFHAMQRSQCLGMLKLKFTRCYRIGMYTVSEQRLVRGAYGDETLIGGGLSNREIFGYVKMPSSGDASDVHIQLQMTAVEGAVTVISDLGECFRESGNTADCATFWIEPFKGD